MTIRRMASSARRGAVIPLFALMLPVILILCAFAINLAQMQLTRTELRIATDASARAAGRAFSEFQDLDTAQSYALSTAPLNNVAGAPLQLTEPEVEFGIGQRGNNGYGRYNFELKNKNAVRNKTQKATSVRITGRRDNGSASGSVPLLLGGFSPISVFQPVATAVSSQVDRDIAMILDKSGSMSWETRDYSEFYHYEWYWSRGRWRRRLVWDDTDMQAEYNLYQTQYDAYEDGGPAPDASRWASLVTAVNAFLDVLEETDQEERVSVSTFSTSANLDMQLQQTYDGIRTFVGGVRPAGWTAIGQGMQEGLPSLTASGFARPYAAKTIVILTDGENNQMPDPVDVATNIIGSTNTTIHTVTFSHGANQDDMADVAEIGHGKHYHANETHELIEIFEEIANNLPTIITH